MERHEVFFKESGTVNNGKDYKAASTSSSSGINEAKKTKSVSASSNKTLEENGSTYKDGCRQAEKEIKSPLTQAQLCPIIPKDCTTLNSEHQSQVPPSTTVAVAVLNNENNATKEKEKSGQPSTRRALKQKWNSPTEIIGKSLDSASTKLSVRNGIQSNNKNPPAKKLPSSTRVCSLQGQHVTVAQHTKQPATGSTNGDTMVSEVPLDHQETNTNDGVLEQATLPNPLSLQRVPVARRSTSKPHWTDRFLTDGMSDSDTASSIIDQKSQVHQINCHSSASPFTEACENNLVLWSSKEDVPTCDQIMVLNPDALRIDECIKTAKISANSFLLSQNSVMVDELTHGFNSESNTNTHEKESRSTITDQAGFSYQRDENERGANHDDLNQKENNNNESVAFSHDHERGANLDDLNQKENNNNESAASSHDLPVLRGRSRGHRNEEVSFQGPAVRSHKKQIKFSGLHSSFEAASSNAAAVRSSLPRDAKAKISDDNIETDTFSGHGRTLSNEIGSESPSGLEISLLSRLDDSEYERSLTLDAINIFTDFAFPISFPWYEPKIVLETTAPFDIEDLPAVIQATGDNDISTSPLALVGRRKKKCNLWQQYQENLASFGFGRYETGRSRRPRGRHSRVKISSRMLCAGHVSCAARRGDEPGVIDFVVKLVPPPREQDSYESRSSGGKNEAQEDGVSRTFAHKTSQLDQEQRRLGDLFESLSTLPWTAPWETPNPCLGIGVDRQRKRFLSIEEYMKLGVTVKRYKLSVRVEGVSSRSTLFSESLLSPDLPRSNQLLAASFPPSISLGKPIQNAVQSDVYAAALGSYDVQHPLMQGNKKSKGNTGRGRLIWTEPCFSAQGGFAYRSSLSRQPMESSQSHKRPHHASVGIRVGGTLICENDKGPTEKAIEKKSINDGENINFFDWSNATCILDHKDYMSALWKTPKRNPDPEILGSKDDGDVLVKYIPPTIISLPCNEGFIRVICLKPGTLQGLDIHETLVNATKRLQKIGYNALGSSVCSVCWTGNIFDKDDRDQAAVFDCIDCALPVHLDCCFDSGVFVDECQRKVWRCAVCRDYRAKTSSGSAEDVKPESDGCSMESPLKDSKPRRRSKLPERYNNDAFSTYASSSRRSSPRTAVDSVEVPVAASCTPVSPEKADKKDYLRPSHKCSLCPHLGGAMSKINKGTMDHESKWTHEICRVWSQTTDAHLRQCFGPVHQAETSCALCGIGRLVNSKNAAREDFGLTKCAAKGCHVFFHPMCATLVSRVPSLPEASRLEPNVAAGEGKKILTLDSKARLSCKNAIDAELVSQYTFQFLSETREEPTAIFDEEETSSIIPVAFCGWHNPRRAPSLFGCPPVTGGIMPTNNMLNWITIPACITEANANEKERVIAKGKARSAKSR